MASGVKRQRSDGFDYDYEAVLLDIEGTTTPISFVKVTNLLIRNRAVAKFEEKFNTQSCVVLLLAELKFKETLNLLLTLL